MKKIFTLLSTFLALGAAAQNLPTYVGSYQTGVFDEGAAEIVAYDAANKQVFFTNADAASIGILDVSNPNNPTLVKNIDITAYGSNANSVAIVGNTVAAAVANENTQANGKVVFFDLNGDYVTDVEVGALPDMVTISSDGNIVMTANEGEPNDDYSVDPNGSISIIDISGGLASLTQNQVTMLDFSAYTLSMLDASTRVFGNNGNQSVAQDLEPEYVTISPDNLTAFVVLQENNAVAIVDLTTKTIENVVGLGFKDHSIAGYGMDASNKSTLINIQPWPVFGIPMPDAIKSFESNGAVYFATANEGDSRDYDRYSEEERIADLTLDASIFPNAAMLQNDTNLGRLNITTSLGDIDNDGEYEALYSYGTRSFSIYDAAGNLIFDSGDDFEQIIAAQYPNQFNSNNDDNDSFKSRSDDKGPEPEAIEVATYNGKTYAFIGMERMGGIFIYDITNPAAPVYMNYYLNRNFTVAADDANAGDLGIEDIKFIPENVSPTGKPMLLTANEISGTVSMFNLDEVLSVQENSKTLIPFAAFPNPNASNTVQLSRKGDYSIFSISGKEIMQCTQCNQFDVSEVAKGTYLIKNTSGAVTKLVRN